MASKKAREFLASCGLARVHTGIELGNFAAGRGNKPFSLPYHVIRMTPDRSGNSKTTQDWCLTLEQARASARKLAQDETDRDVSRGGADTLRQDRATFYIRDIRDGKIYRP